MASWKESYDYARSVVEQQMLEEAREQFGAQNIASYTPIPGLNRGYVHSWSRKFEFIYTVEREKTVQTGSNEHIGVYDDGSTVLLDSKPIYGTQKWIETRKDTRTAYLEFVVLKNPSLVSEYRRLANDSNREVAYYDFKGNEGPGVAKAKAFVRKKLIHEGFVMLLATLYLFIVSALASAEKIPFALARNMAGIGSLATLGYLIIYQFIRKRNEENYVTVAQDKYIRPKSFTFSFIDMGILAVLLLFIYCFGKSIPMWIVIAFVFHVMVAFSLGTTLNVSKGFGRIYKGREHHARMVKRRNSKEYADYYDRCVNFCKNSFM